MSQDVRCLLWGGYARGNTGDELTLAVGLRDMQARFGDAVAILSPSPGYTMRQFPGVRVICYEPVFAPNYNSFNRRLFQKIAAQASCRPIWRYRPKNQTGGWASHVRAGELLYLIGGGYVTDLFDLDYVLLPVRVAKEAGVKITSAPLGVGPFGQPQTVRKAVEALSGAALLVRDEASFGFCLRHGLSAKLVRDDGFRVREILDFKVEENILTVGKPRIGVNIFHQHGSSTFAKTKVWWCELLRTLAQAPVSIEAFCFHSDVFMDFSQAAECFVTAGLDSMAVRSPAIDFRASCRQLGDFDVIVSSRFHAVVVGNLLNKVTIAIYDSDYYLHKMKAAADGFERSKTLGLADTSASNAATLILRAAFARR